MTPGAVRRGGMGRRLRQQPHSLRTRLAWAFALVAALVVVVTAVTTLLLVRLVAEQQTAVRLTHQAQVLASSGSPRGICHARRVLKTTHISVFLVRHGALVACAPSSAVPAISVSPLLAGHTSSGVVGQDAWAGAPVDPFDLPAHAPEAVVLLRPVLAPGVALVTTVADRLAVGALLAVVVAGAAGWLLSNRLVAPLRRLVGAARRLGTGDLATRVAPEGHDEVAEVARAFNEMAAALEREQEAQRSFLASVGHELKTPLTSVQGYTEALLDGAIAEQGRELTLQRIHAESLRLGRLVQDLTDLARLGRGQFEVEPLVGDPVSILRDAASAAAHRAGVGASIEVSADEEVRALFDPMRLRQVIDNLLDNAVRSSPPDGIVRLRTECLPDGRVEVSVSDQGPGIATADLPRAFDRGYLWSRYRGTRAVGSGLGLSIVKGLCDAMGAGIEAEAEPEGGTRFRLLLAAAPSPRAALGEGSAAARE